MCGTGTADVVGILPLLHGGFVGGRVDVLGAGCGEHYRDLGGMIGDRYVDLIGEGYLGGG